jgi:hypothetical protein
MPSKPEIPPPETTSAEGDTATKNYEVGYAKPPQSTRFKKGQSGNPKGRPRKVKPKTKNYNLSQLNADTFFEQEIFRPIGVIENGKRVEMPVALAMERRYHALGLNGNRLALERSLERLERKERKHFKLKMRRFIRLKKLKAQGEAILARCHAEGKEPPELIPHPDDIELNDQTYEVNVDGPESRTEVRHWEYVCRLRDYLMCHALRRHGIDRVVNTEPDGEIVMGLGWYLALDLDRTTIPKRLRLDVAAIMNLDIRARAPKRSWESYASQEKAWLDQNCHLNSRELPESLVKKLKEALHTGLSHQRARSGLRKEGARYVWIDQAPMSAAG